MRVDTMVRSAIIVLAWVLGCQLPGQWIQSDRINFYLVTSIGPTEHLLVSVGSFARYLAEGIVLVLLIGVVKRGQALVPQRLRGCAYMVCALTVLILALVILCLAVSWYLFAFTEGFLNINEILAVLTTPKSIFGSTVLTTEIDRFRFWMTTGCAFLIALAVFIYTPRSNTWKHIITLMFLGLVFLVGAYGCLVVLPQNRLPSAQFVEFRKYVKFLSAPDLALFSHWTQTSSSIRDEKGFELSLERIVNLSTYSVGLNALDNSQKTRPNIVLIAVEALRADAFSTKVNGIPVMPFLSDRGNSGAIFGKFFAQSSESNYSLFTIFSGLYPLKRFFRDLFVPIDYPCVRIYDLLSHLGYRTGLVISDSDQWQNLGSALKSPSLDMYFVAGQNAASVQNGESIPGLFRYDQASVEAIKQFALGAKTAKRPFFVGTFLVSSHFPYYQDFVTDPIYSDVNLSKTESGSLSFVSYPLELTEKMRKRYLNNLHQVDWLIKDLYDTLATNDLLKDTIFIVTGDHGELFGEHRSVTHAGKLYPEILRIPLIVWGQDLPPLDTEGVYGHLDIIPSIIDLLGLPPYGNYQGKSFVLPRSQKTKPGVYIPLFASVQSIADQDAVIDWPWLFTVDHNGEADAVNALENIENGQIPNRECLGRLVDRYRSAQLGYYNGSGEIRGKFFPPKFTLYHSCTVHELNTSP